MMSSLVAAYPWVLLVIGVLAVVLGLDRTFKRKGEESFFLRMAGIAAGALEVPEYAFVDLAVVDEGDDA